MNVDGNPELSDVAGRDANWRPPPVDAKAEDEEKQAKSGGNLW